MIESSHFRKMNVGVIDIHQTFQIHTGKLQHLGKILYFLRGGKSWEKEKVKFCLLRALPLIW